MKAHGETLDACLVGEPTSAKVVGDEIKIGRRGYLNAEIVVQGKQGHSAYGHLADNPIPKLARIIDRLSSTPLDAGSPNFQPSSLQPTVVSVPNTATNVIPGSARPTSTSATTTCTRAPSVEAGCESSARAAAREDGATFSLTFFGNGDVFLTEPGPLVETMVEAVRCGYGPQAGADHQRRHLGRALHLRPFPVIEIGLRNATAHQVDEHVPVADLATLTAIYRRFIEGYFGG